MRTVGLDLGKRKTTWCEIREDGTVVRGAVANLEELTALLGPEQPPAQVAFEACREGWHVHDQLEEWGNKPLMVDTTRVGRLGIGQHGRKNDEIDAEVLARALAENRLPLAHVLSSHRRDLRRALAVRAQLVATRAKFVALMREMLRAQGVRVPSCATEHFLEALRDVELTGERATEIEPLVQTLCTVQEQIAVAQRRLHERAEQEPATARLTSIRGVSLITAATFVAVIDNVSRFRHASNVVSYVGLCPSEKTTGGRRRLGSITKQGNAYLRAMLVQAAWCVLRGPATDPLSVWGRQVAQRRGKKVAAIAIARRLVRTMFAIWKNETVYDPVGLSLASAKGKRFEAVRKEGDAKQIERAARILAKTVTDAEKHASRARASRSVVAELSTC